jgi:hypothetical protein
MHGLHHVLHDWIKYFPRLLWITVRKKLHRSLHVSEQNRDLLPLPFESALGRENFLSEMFWGICLWRGELQNGLLYREKGLAAPTAKLFTSLI